MDVEEPADVEDDALVGGRDEPVPAGLEREERERDEREEDEEDSATEESDEDDSTDDEASDEEAAELSDDTADDEASAEEADEDLALPGFVRDGFDCVPPDDFELAAVAAFLAALLACCIWTSFTWLIRSVGALMRLVTPAKMIERKSTPSRYQGNFRDPMQAAGRKACTMEKT